MFGVAYICDQPQECASKLQCFITLAVMLCFVWSMNGFVGKNYSFLISSDLLIGWGQTETADL